MQDSLYYKDLKVYKIAAETEFGKYNFFVPQEL